MNFSKAVRYSGSCYWHWSGNRMDFSFFFYWKNNCLDQKDSEITIKSLVGTYKRIHTTILTWQNISEDLT